MTLSASFTRTAFAIASVFLIYSGGLLLWGLANSVGVHSGCYDLPFYAQRLWTPCLNVSAAGDFGITLILVGGVLSFVGMRVGKSSLDVEV